MSFKGILFDFDGVVVDSMHQHYDAWRDAFSEKKIIFSKEEFFQLEGQGISQIVKMLAEPHGLVEKEMLDIIEAKARYYYTFEKTLFYEYFLTMLENIKNIKIPMAVVTGGNKDRVLKTIKEHLEGYFQAVVTIDDVTNGKPHPEPFIKGAEKLGFEPQQCIVIENAPMGVKAAKAAGCKVIAIKTTLSEKFLSEADYVLSTFQQVEEKIFSLLAN